MREPNLSLPGDFQIRAVHLCVGGSLNSTTLDPPDPCAYCSPVQAKKKKKSTGVSRAHFLIIVQNFQSQLNTYSTFLLTYVHSLRSTSRQQHLSNDCSKHLAVSCRRCNVCRSLQKLIPGHRLNIYLFFGSFFASST